MEASTGWERNAAFFYRDGDETDYDTKPLDSESTDLWFVCDDCKAEFWDDGKSLVLESEWNARA